LRQSIEINTTLAAGGPAYRTSEHDTKRKNATSASREDVACIFGSTVERIASSLSERSGLSRPQGFIA